VTGPFFWRAQNGCVFARARPAVSFATKCVHRGTNVRSNTKKSSSPIRKSDVEMHKILLNSLDVVNEHSEKTMALAACLGARVVVMTTLIDAMFPHLSVSQRLEVSRSFRLGVENVMSLTDDRIMPEEFHAALLEQTNVFLAALKPLD